MSVRWSEPSDTRPRLVDTRNTHPEFDDGMTDRQFVCLLAGLGVAWLVIAALIAWRIGA